eukprot:scaffold40176_cov38-Prasinocladus_malaysianus.AAC.1
MSSHKEFEGVSLGGLGLSSAVIACGDEDSLRGMAANALAGNGTFLMRGVLGTLLGSAPLGRLHKVSSLLVDIMRLLTRASQGPEHATEVALRWLSEALDSLPSGTLLPGASGLQLQSYPKPLWPKN